MVTIPAFIFWIFFGAFLAPQAYGAIALLITALMILEGLTYIVAGFKSGEPGAIFFGLFVGLIGYCCVAGYVNTVAERNEVKEKIAASPTGKYIRDAIVLETRKWVDVTEPTKFKFLDTNEVVYLTEYGDSAYAFAEAPYRPGELIQFDKVLDSSGSVKHYGRITDVKMTVTEVRPAKKEGLLHYYYTVDEFDRKREWMNSEPDLVKVGDKCILKNGKEFFKLDNGQEIRMPFR